LHVGNAHNTPQTKKYENRQKQQPSPTQTGSRKQTTSADMNACAKKSTTNLEESEKKKNAAGNANPPMQQVLLELEKSNPQLKQQKNNTTCNRNKRLLYSLNC
jgi:hypothetical protein